MQTCPITTLKKHSAGESYSPIQNGIDWRLENSSGDVLTGYRGKIYAFKSAENARTWLCSNLGRVKNSQVATPIDFIVKLHVIYGETQNAIVLAELQSIKDLDAGVWQPILCESDCDCENEPIDGGNAVSIYTNFINQ